MKPAFVDPRGRERLTRSHLSNTGGDAVDKGSQLIAFAAVPVFSVLLKWNLGQLPVGRGIAHPLTMPTF